MDAEREDEPLDREKTLMTPGPTAVPPDVREAMARPIHNPDVEPEFAGIYGKLLEKLGTVYGTSDDVHVLAGEGMLGLEASVASVIEPGDAVLCLANGLFGAGFADLVELHGGEPTIYEVPADREFDTNEIEQLVDDEEFVAATMIHCETPTGLLNDLDDVLGVLSEAGVLTIVDAVSSLGGTPVPDDGVDICLGASQKCFSAPPGLTTLTVSDAAWERVHAVEQRSFYTSLEPWAEVDPADGPVGTPYTHSVSNLYALDVALDRLLDEGLKNVYDRHKAAAERCIERGAELGLEPYISDPLLRSPTVTAFEIDGRAVEVQQRVDDEHGIVLGTGLGDLTDDIIRVGHMGYAAEVDLVDRTMDALEAVFEE